MSDPLGNNQFLEQARQGKNSIWRYLATLFLIIALNILVTTMMLGAAVLLYGTFDLNAMPELFVLVLAMVPFLFSAIGLWIGLRFIHRRPFLSLLTAHHTIRWRTLLISGAVWFALSAISDLVFVFLRPGNLVWSFDPVRFLPFFVLAIILVPIQAGTEELIFRGYLTQGFGLLARGAWLALIAPSLLFGLLHGVNPEIEAYGLRVMMVYYIGMGLFLGFITLRSEGLEMAVGVHIANNLYASLMVTFSDSAIPSPALFTVREFDPVSGLVVFILSIAVYLLLMFRWMRRSKAVSGQVVELHEMQ